MEEKVYLQRRDSDKAWHCLRFAKFFAQNQVSDPFCIFDALIQQHSRIAEQSPFSLHVGVGHHPGQELDKELELGEWIGCAILHHVDTKVDSKYNQCQQVGT